MFIDLSAPETVYFLSYQHRSLFWAAPSNLFHLSSPSWGIPAWNPLSFIYVFCILVKALIVFSKGDALEWTEYFSWGLTGALQELTLAVVDSASTLYGRFLIQESCSMFSLSSHLQTISGFFFSSHTHHPLISCQMNDSGLASPNNTTEILNNNYVTCINPTSLMQDLSKTCFTRAL